MQALELFDDAPHTEHAVTLFNQDFRHAGQTDELTIYQAEYALKAPDLECLHCLLADQLAGEDDETPWLSAPVMAAYVSLAERRTEFRFGSTTPFAFLKTGRNYI